MVAADRYWERSSSDSGPFEDESSSSSPSSSSSSLSENHYTFDPNSYSSSESGSENESMYQSSSSQSDDHSSSYDYQGPHYTPPSDPTSSNPVSSGSENYRDDEDYENRYTYNHAGGGEYDPRRYDDEVVDVDRQHIIALNEDGEGDSTIHHSANTTIDNSKSNSNSTQTMPKGMKDGEMKKQPKSNMKRRVYRGRRKPGNEKDEDNDDNDNNVPPPQQQQQQQQQEKKLRGFLGKILPAFGAKKKMFGKKSQSATNSVETPAAETTTTSSTAKKKTKSKKKKDPPSVVDDESDGGDSYSIQIMDDGSSIASEPSQNPYGRYTGRKDKKYANRMPGVAEEEEEEESSSSYMGTGTESKEDDVYYHRNIQGHMEPLLEDEEEDQTVDDSSRLNFMGSNDDSSGMHNNIHALIQRNMLREADSRFYTNEPNVQPFFPPPQSYDTTTGKQQKKPKKSTKKSKSYPPVQNVHASPDVSSNTSNATHPTGNPYPNMSPLQVTEIQAEVIKLRLLVTLMMKRMELYERQSECVLEAGLEHDQEWKKAIMASFEQSAKRTSSGSDALVRLSTIKGLIEERAATNQWIKQLELVTRGYQQRVTTAQAQLKSLRYEQVHTNKHIIDLKREQNQLKKSAVAASIAMPTGENTGSAHKKPAAPKATPKPSLPMHNKSEKSSRSALSATSTLYSAAGYALPSEEYKTSSLVEDMMTNWSMEGSHVSDAINPARVTMTGGVSTKSLVGSNKGRKSRRDNSVSKSSSTGYAASSKYGGSSSDEYKKKKKKDASKKKKKTTKG